MRRCHLAAAAPAVLALAASAVAPISALAQSGATAPAVAAPPQASPAGALVFSAGTELGGFDHVLGRYTHGATAQVGYERRLGRVGSPFALRLAGDYWRSGGNTFAPYRGIGGSEDLTYNRRTKIFGGSVLGVYHLPTLGAVRPYALAGVGVYQYGGVNEAPVPGGGTVVYQAGDHQTSVAYTGGVGGSVRVGRVDVFGEGRLMNMPGLSRVASTRMPLTFGARLPF